MRSINLRYTYLLYEWEGLI